MEKKNAKVIDKIKTFRIIEILYYICIIFKIIILYECLAIADGYFNANVGFAKRELLYMLPCLLTLNTPPGRFSHWK